MYSYLIYQIICHKKQKKNLTIIWYCLLVHYILFFSMLIVTIFIRPIMYYRYMLITSGIILFPFAYFLFSNSTKHQKIISSIVVMIILGLSIYNNSIIIEENYDSTNGEEVRYIQEQYKEGNMILYQDYFHASNIFVQMPEYNWYLYHIDPNHDVTPFENYSLPLKITFEEDFLDDYHGRIILIDHEGLEWYNEMAEKYDLKEIARKKIRPKYRGFVYQIITVEKE